MSDRCFADSNIWLYHFMEQGETKKEKALKVLTNPNIIISTQVLNEVCVNLIRKADYTEAEIQQTIDNISNRYEVIPITTNLCSEASHLRQSYSLSYWDSLIVATALAANCKTLYSEDMQHNQKIAITTIINPFL